MNQTPITWDETPERLAADPTATLGLDRSAWEALGATFSEVDDGQGETPGLAIATVQTRDGEVRVGILDYGEDSTYLLVPGVEPRRRATTVTVLEAFESMSAVRLDTDLLDVADGEPALTLEERVVDLEQHVAELLRSSSSTAVSHRFMGTRLLRKSPK